MALTYRLRYNYGIFKQLLSKNGEQLEAPDPWLDRENVSSAVWSSLMASPGKLRA
jgi:glucan phosphorylase